MTCRFSIIFKMMVGEIIMISFMAVPLVAGATETGSSYALTVEKSSDYSEIKGLIPEMKRWAEGDKLSDFEITDKDLSHACRVYTDFDPGKIEDNTSGSLEKYFKKSDYVWEVPVNISGTTYTYTVGKGLPLSEEGKKNLSSAEQAQIKEDEGKLKIYSFGKGKDLYDLIRGKTSLKSYDQIFVVGGIPGKRDLYILGIRNNAADTFIPISDESVSETISWKDMRTVSQKAAAEYSRDKQQKVSGIDTASDSKKDQTASQPGYRTAMLIIIVGAVLLLVLILTVRHRNDIFRMPRQS